MNEQIINELFRNVIRIDKAVTDLVRPEVATGIPVGGTGANTQVAYWTGTDTIAGDAGMTYNAATNSLTAGNYYTVDGGAFGISGNELLTVNAAGTFAFSGISGVSVENGDWIGAGSGCAWLYDSGNGDISTDVNVGIGTTGPVRLTHWYANDTATSTQLYIEQAGSGDAGIGFVLTGVQAWAMGIDNSDGNKLKIARSSTNVATNTVMTLDTSGNIGIGTTVILAKNHIDQASTTATIPVLALDQGDVSEEFINYVGASAASVANPISTWTTGNSIQGFVRVGINNTFYWMPYYDAPTA